MTKEEAVIILDGFKNNPLFSDTHAQALDLAISALSENKGEWTKIQSGDDKFPESIVCSKCKNENSHLDFDEHGEPIGKVFITSNFCPNCGADMREPKDIIHNAIDNTTFAEEAYPNIKEELHKAVDMAESKGEKGTG